MTAVPSANCVSDQDDLLVSLSDLSKSSLRDGPVKRKNKGQFSNEIQYKQAKFSDKDVLLFDVIDDFELSITVVNVVSYISGYILKKFMIQAKCSDCFRLLTDTSTVATESNLLCHLKVYKHKEQTGFSSLCAPSPYFSKFLERVERVFQIIICKVMVLTGILSRLFQSVHDIIPSRVLKLCPKHRNGDYIKYIAKLYVRCRLH